MKGNEQAMLSLLRTNARAKFTEMAKVLGLPLTTAFELFRRVERRYITRHTTLYAFDACSYPISVFYLVRARKEQRDAVKALLRAHPLVNSSASADDHSTFVCEMIFANLRDQHLFEERLMDIPVLRYERHEVLEELGRERFLAGV